MKTLSRIFDFIFPRECHICGNNLPAGQDYVCAACLSRLPRTLYHRVKDNPMERRFMGQFPYRCATGYFFYSRGSEIATLMHDLKYRKFRGLARFMGKFVAEELSVTGYLSDIDMIMPIPMHFIKKARRGYNQTEEISLGISSVTGIPVVDNLKAVRGHKTQTSLSLQQRIRNIDGVFKVVRSEELKNKKILLVDDVCTTGTTLSCAATELSQSAVGIELTILTLGVTF